MDNDIISAFAYNTGKEIEKIIHEQVDNIQETNKLLMGKILDFRQKILLNSGLSDFSILAKYDEYFQIEKL